MNNQKGFTLIEMLIVLTIISTLLILLVPNLADKNNKLQTKGCNALAQMADSQMQAYEIETGEPPTSIQDLIDNDYLKTDKCANDTQQVTISTDGNVEVVDSVDDSDVTTP